MTAVWPGDVICEECGNDLAVEDGRLCLECLEALERGEDDCP